MKFPKVFQQKKATASDVVAGVAAFIEPLDDVGCDWYDSTSILQVPMDQPVSLYKVHDLYHEYATDTMVGLIKMGLLTVAMRRLSQEWVPVAAWAIEHGIDADSTNEQAIALVVDALPCRPERLDALAIEHCWCHQYGELLTEADKAGVLAYMERLMDEAEKKKVTS